MHKMHLKTCRLCGCVNDIRNLSGRQASKTDFVDSQSRAAFETTHADRHRKFADFAPVGKSHPKPLNSKVTYIQNTKKARYHSDIGLWLLFCVFYSQHHLLSGYFNSSTSLPFMTSIPSAAAARSKFSLFFAYALKLNTQSSFLDITLPMEFARPSNS